MGSASPRQYQGFAVPAQSVRVIDVNAIIGDQTRIGVSVVATRGRVVVGRSQLLDTPDRTGYVMTLAAPAVRDQWWFVYGERADNVVENYYLYNPGEEDAEVTPVLLGFQPPAGMEPPDTIVVPDGEVVEFRMADVADLPDGPHSVVFGTEPTTPVVVERVLTRTIDDGGDDLDHPRGDHPARRLRRQHVVRRTRPGGRHAAGALALYNNTTAESVVTLQAITPQGVQNVAGLRRHRRRPRGDPLPRPHRHGASATS